MPVSRERILVVENDPAISDLVSRQALQPAGYQVLVVNDASTAIQKGIQFSPDAVIVNLHLPDLSAKDMMVALTAQGMDAPVVIMGAKGSESEVIQAFRLGAIDTLLWPVREAEVINVVERVLVQIRERRERAHLAQQLQDMNQELQQRVRELTTLFSVGKTVTSVTDQNTLYEKILDSAARVTQADLGWFLLREDKGKKLFLVTQRNLPTALTVNLNKAWDDGISSLVAISAETLNLHGDPVGRFRISTLGQSALIVPIKAQRQVIGVISLMRKKPKPFSASEQSLAEAVADYASISLINSRLFRALEERAQSHQMAAENAQAVVRVSESLLDSARSELRPALANTQTALDVLSKDPSIRWFKEQKSLLEDLQEKIDDLRRIGEAIAPIPYLKSSLPAGQVNLTDIAKHAEKRFRSFAQHNKISLTCEVYASVIAAGDLRQIYATLESMLAEAIRRCQPNNQLVIQVAVNDEQKAQVTIIDKDTVIPPNEIPVLFMPGEKSKPFSGLAVDLSIAQELIKHQKGALWAESKPGEGTRYCLSLT
ncbi:MAG TPA: hybrid sensor histidine kinase/response regulator, partial [Longilinea sp.]|nr:hybrid sensor histidine kinase/response regulator [Longilinea sp.]